jgi:hypothetical protein
VYQYFTPKELRQNVRQESQAPRNSYELAFRNQFFTPRYVVEFLTDNTLGRIWYGMRKGDTALKDQCRYMVRRPNEVFLMQGQEPPTDAATETDLSQEELLKRPAFIPHRPKKDPRELKIMDPASGSAHFLLYGFDLLETIYVEAYDDPDLGRALKKDYPTIDALLKDVPRLILAHNLYGIDIDKRATQIAALALWLRCQRAYKEMGLTKDRPKITRSNMVCAEPMPGEKEMLKEFTAELQPKLLGHLVEVVFDKMKLAGEAGSLLKIEEELREAIANAKRQWATEHERAVDKKGHPMLFSQAEMARTERGPRQPQLFDVSEITEEQFWNEAEGMVVDALRDYAAHATNGGRLRRQLFAEDAGHGFAFVDMCQKRFDVVLMNPPFGQPSLGASRYTDEGYSDSKAELYAAFVRRGVSLLIPTGILGAITSRLALFSSTLEHWRREYLLGESHLLHLADLGHGVLDDAAVEAVAYTIERNRTAEEGMCVLPALGSANKGDRLAILCRPDSLDVSLTHISLFAALPYATIAYWLPPRFVQSFVSFPSFAPTNGVARVGLKTDDDFRFLRLAWECSPHSIGRRWRFFAKGGEYSPFYDDIHLLVDWDDDGKAMRKFIEQKYSWTKRASSVDRYGDPGLTYPERTTSEFSPRPLPKGTFFSNAGQAILCKDEPTSDAMLAICYTRLFRIILEMFVGSGELARHYRAGLLSSCPIPPLVGPIAVELAQNGGTAAKCAREGWSENETSRFFQGLALAGHGTVKDVALVRCVRDEDRWLNLANLSWRNEVLVQALYALSPVDRMMVDRLYGIHPTQYSDGGIDDADLMRWMSMSPDALVDMVCANAGKTRQHSKLSHWADRRYEGIAHLTRKSLSDVIGARRRLGWIPNDRIVQAAKDVLSFAVGCSFGRWDIKSTYQGTDGVGCGLYEELPATPPAALSLPVSQCEAPVDYPFEVEWSGIILDDTNHPSDIVQRVRDFLEVSWGGRTEAIENEICAILGIDALRDYFRKPGNGGFWDDHISRYSKSRRKAPIYWLLQSSKKNYAVWLYYHRLDKDILFKALVNYVEPKIRLEENRLAGMRGQKGPQGESGKEAKKIEKDMEKQEEFISELRDFEEKLRRAANFHLTPDLNDGVVLNIAPLWELVPWKDAKAYWEELMEGKYEWSSIGKQLREKGLVK